MIYIKLVKHPLIYGLAFLWMFGQFIIPQPWWPDLSNANNVKFLSIPSMKSYYKVHTLVARRLDSLKSMKKVLRFINYIFIVVIYSVYHFELLEASVEGYKGFLDSYGIKETNTLSFKFVYYTYFVWKISTLIMLVYSVSDCGWLQNSWKAHDKYSIFSVDFDIQLRLACVSFFIGFLDGCIEYLKIVSFMSYVPENQFIILRMLHYNYTPPLNLMWQVRLAIYLFSSVATVFNLLAQCIKYRPLVYSLYSAQCISFHLHSINSQLDEFEASERESSEQKLDIWTSDNFAPPQRPSNMSKYSSLFSRTSRFNNKIHSVHEFVNSVEAGRRLDNFRSSKVIVDVFPNEQRQPLPQEFHTIRDTKSTSLKSLTSLSPPSSSSSSSPLLSLSLIKRGLVDENRSRVISGSSESDREEQHDHYLETISSLRQLERHLNQLNLFIYDLDTSLSVVLSITCLLCLYQFISNAFLVVGAWRCGSGCIVSAVLLAIAPMSAPFLLFYSGNQMELESHRLYCHLDRIYLHDPTQCLIYKQYHTSMESLKRATQLLKGIRFDCVNLMKINLETMKMFILYTITLVFFVIQYDSLNNLYDAKPKPPTDQQTGAAVNVSRA